jgi:hypothetical protein
MRATRKAKKPDARKPVDLVNSGPSLRFSADRSAKMCVMARDFESFFLRTLRSPPEIGG